MQHVKLRVMADGLYQAVITVDGYRDVQKVAVFEGNKIIYR